LIGFLKEKTGFPAMRNVWSCQKPKTKFASGENLIIVHCSCRTICEVVETDICAHEAANGCGIWRNIEPLIERSAFVGLEVAKANTTKRSGIDQGRNCIAHVRENAPHSGVKKQRLFVAYEKLVELNVHFGH